MALGGRRSTVGWAHPVDDGDAAAAVEEHAAWLARRPPARDEAELTAALSPLRDTLQRLLAEPLVRRDPVCRKLLADLDPADPLEALDAALDAVGRRIAELVARRDAPGAATMSGSDLAAADRRTRALREHLRL